jgi:hypothetical protein
MLESNGLPSEIQTKGCASSLTFVAVNAWVLQATLVARSPVSILLDGSDPDGMP